MVFAVCASGADGLGGWLLVGGGVRSEAARSSKVKIKIILLALRVEEHQEVLPKCCQDAGVSRQGTARGGEFLLLGFRVVE
ncbi:hypothetical protein E2C01_012682 [Portunus trituberculatus]|uniref:Uncharacterized protein n=1 Tax=Portunus trituberculatus TaxID=210409 RepID=A0A5B7DEW3_PORTR|nr:hypothetical protein [Portunus trituberculatus]